MSYFIIQWIYLFNFILTFITFANGNRAYSIRHGKCEQKIFNETNLEEASFRASSVWEKKPEFQPFNVKISSLYSPHTTGSAWCPEQLASQTPNDYIEIDLEQMFFLNLIFTAGRGEGNFDEYTENYMIKYQRVTNGEWFVYTKKDGSRILSGNKNARITERLRLDPPIVAKAVRVYPMQLKGEKRVCLRLAFIGCPFDDSIVKYSMPQGSSNSAKLPYLDLTDTTYPLKATYLDNGLGQLTDNLAAFFNFKLAEKSDSLVGWYRNDLQKTHLTIDFQFSSLRNVSSIGIFSVNNPRMNAAVYKSLEILYSRDEIEPILSHSVYQTNNLEKTQLSETKQLQITHLLASDKTAIIQPNSDTDSVLLTYHLDRQQPLFAKRLRMTFEFSDNWILLSEVVIRSSPIAENHIPPTNVDGSENQFASILPQTSERPIELKDPDPIILSTRDEAHVVKSVTGPEVDDFITNRPSSFLLIGGSIFVAFTLSLILAFILHFYCNRKKRPDDDDAHLTKQGNIINQNSYQTLGFNHGHMAMQDPMNPFNLQIGNGQYHTMMPNNGKKPNLIMNNMSNQSIAHIIAQQQQQQTQSIPMSLTNSDDTTHQHQNNSLNSKTKDDSISPMSFAEEFSHQLQNGSLSPNMQPHHNNNTYESEGQDYASASICGNHLPQTKAEQQAKYFQQQNQANAFLQMYQLQTGPRHNNNFLNQTLHRLPHNGAIQNFGPTTMANQTMNTWNPQELVAVQQFNQPILDHNQNRIYPDMYQNLIQGSAFHPPMNNNNNQIRPIKPPEPPLNHPSTMNAKRNSVYSVCI